MTGQKLEKAFIKWLFDRRLEPAGIVRLGIGDDAAIIQSPEPLVITVDSIADGTHFDCGLHPLDLIGRKAMAVNLSDLAAMAAEPTAALLSMHLPTTMGIEQAEQIYLGAERLGLEFDLQIIGGDTNRWDGPLVVAVTAVGQVLPDPTGQRIAWRMDGGSPSDTILVSGSLGGSLAGSHLTFQPRVALAAYLQQHYSINAATDISDSLASDLFQVATASGCGFELIAANIPVSEAAQNLAKSESGNSALERALYDGEDFELAICTSAETAESIIHDNALPCPVFIIGKLTADQSCKILNFDGQWQELPIRGYEH